jgi:hypothetical protein
MYENKLDASIIISGYTAITYLETELPFENQP